MKKYKDINIDLKNRSYKIIINDNIEDTLLNVVSEIISRPKVFIVTDENVAGFILPSIRKILDDGNIETQVIMVPSGERSKSFNQLENLITELLKLKIERQDTLVALGGGVIGDLVGFAASIIFRGIDFIQIPTTLLSQVDSSVGGKTAINMGEGKNLVGSFYQPKAVLADVSLLSTLPHREVVSGYAEIIKYAILGDKIFFEWLKNNQNDILKLNTDLLIDAVSKSCEMKAKIVEEDEHERGSRALLNLGHTFGHAVENKINMEGSGILHGEAIGFGMCLSAQFSNKMQLCSDNDVEEIIKIIKDAGIPSNCSDLTRNYKIELKANEIIDIFARDKKRKDNKNTLILLNGIGKAFVREGVKDADINDFLISIGFK